MVDDVVVGGYTRKGNRKSDNCKVEVFLEQ